MLQIKSLKIQNVRGIRELELTPNGDSFAIQGPNGTGKSGVVDAIDFAVTGKISRFAGEGMSDVSLKKHGPHVDFVDKPDQVRVELTAYLTDLKIDATITRNLKYPSNPKYTPNTEAVKAAFQKIGNHSEFALSRRQIIKFIISTAAKRSANIEELLQLKKVNQVRKALATALNKADSNFGLAKQRTGQELQSYLAHLGISKVSESLTVVNLKRKILGVAAIDSLDETTSFIVGVKDQASSATIVKATALADIKTLREKSSLTPLQPSFDALEKYSQALSDDQSLRLAVQQQQLVSLGMDLMTADACPLCDSVFDLESLKEHLLKKQKNLEEAAELSRQLETATKAIGDWVRDLSHAANGVLHHVKKLKLADHAATISYWLGSLQSILERLKSTEGAIELADELSNSLGVPSLVEDAISNIIQVVEEIPDVSATIEARSFLLEAERRMQLVRDAKAAGNACIAIQSLAQSSYDSFQTAAESTLEDLYSSVMEDFAKYYATVNASDESDFGGQIQAEEGKLYFDVDFFDRGRFPPGALHSEGHQDTMGLCLYLALMRKVFGDDFRLVVLDDVIMSVDSGHRRALCEMLKSEFPNTQFIITTHEKAWFKQMQETKLIHPGKGKEFQSWNVADGPRVADANSSWEAIDDAVSSNKISVAAPLLRRYIEFVGWELVEELGGSVKLRRAASYNGGELILSATKRMAELLKIASRANITCSQKQQQLVEFAQRFKESNARQQVSAWAINSCTHYNPWENYVTEDFAPVVQVFKEFVRCFRCHECESWLYVSPRGCHADKEESLRCNCNIVNINLQKPNPVMRSKRKKRSHSESASNN